MLTDRAKAVSPINDFGVMATNPASMVMVDDQAPPR